MLQLIGGIILAIGYIPQIVKIVRTKSAADFELRTYLLLLLGIGCMEVYAINLVLAGSGGMFLITNTLSLLIAAVMCLLIRQYQGSPGMGKRNDEKRLYEKYERELCRGIIAERVNLWYQHHPEKRKEIMNNAKMMDRMAGELAKASNMRKLLTDIADEIVSPGTGQK